ncbi:BadF/BadG/BcrA/BcrD ATPase family protein, partial [Dermatophilus congolensis]
TTCQPLLTTGSTPPQHVIAAIDPTTHSLDLGHLHTRLTHETNAPTLVVDSLLTTLFGALENVHAGVIVDLGATAAGLATNLKDTWQRLDGWGNLLGGRGSAAWIGKEGLCAALRARDGVPNGSETLLDLARNAFGTENAWPQLFSTPRTHDLLADFAPLVARACVDGDPIAQFIIRAAGEHIADTLTAGTSLVPDSAITVTGELLMIEAVKIAIASALGKRRLFLVPALHDSRYGAEKLGEWLCEGNQLPHKPPFVHRGDHRALSAT